MAKLMIEFLLEIITFHFLLSLCHHHKEEKMKGAVRERSKGKYSYYFKYKDEYGKWRTKEKSGFASKKEAQSALRKAITEFEEDGFLLTNQDSYTLETLVTRWYEDVASLNLSYHTLRTYKGIIKNHICNEIGHLKLTSITPVIMQKFLVDKSKTCGNVTLLHIKSILKSSFQFGVKQQLIKQNPINLVEGVGKRKKRKKEKFLSKEEIDDLLLDIKDTDYYLPSLIAINTGMRRGEILGLTWKDVDLDNHIINVNKQLLTTEDGLVFSKLKTSYSNRRFFITESFVENLKEIRQAQLDRKAFYGEHYYQEYDFVCCKKDGHPLNPDGMTNFFTRKSKEMGIPFSFHDLRHAHASLLLEADVNVKVIQERLGHSQISTTLDVYSHITNKLERDSIEKFEKVFATKK